MQASIVMPLDAYDASTPVTHAKASLAITTIEFFDFYIYATAAVIVFPHSFFPQGDPTTATLQSLATRRHLYRTANWLGAVRPLRQSCRPQGDAGRLAADHGDLHRLVPTTRRW